jgi:SAM-dependent methyltransferase
MTMEQKEAVIRCYDDTSDVYYHTYGDELAAKSLDRLLLNRFAEDNRKEGLILDLGCGPGHTTHFLHDRGLTNLLGIDLSSRMVGIAQTSCHPDLLFEVGDMEKLRFADKAIGGILCFYGIVHFKPEELEAVFMEMARVLKKGGQLLFSFHVGKEAHALDEFLGKEVKVTFFYFEVEWVKKCLKKVGFHPLEVLERHPYEGVEDPGKRAYILAEKI